MNAALNNGAHCERRAHNLRRSWRERSGYSVAAGPEISHCDKKKRLSQAA